MSADSLAFNGTELICKGHGNFKATSGNVFADVKTSEVHDYQQAKFQDLSDRGPIPEGQYSFQAFIAAGSAFDRNGRLDTRQGIEQLAPEGSNMATPTGWKKAVDASAVLADWGHNRVRLNVLHINHLKAQNRGGFYIHDSHKGHTHGCIEVAHAFFDQLRAYSADQKKLGKAAKNTLRLIVKYPSATASTNGGTLF